MAPSAVDTPIEGPVSSKSVFTEFPEPLKLSRALDAYESFEVTPVIGKEFPKASLVEWLNAPNSDELLRDLAITISQRGVVFFRAQDDLTNDLQKKLILRLGELTGRPKTSSLHIHPVLNSERNLGGDDPEISTISSKQFQQLKINEADHEERSTKKQNNAQWHSDIGFEPVPADYTSLRLIEFPETGGDTLWASGYEVYDRISEPYQKFLEGLTATFKGQQFNKIAEQGGFEIYTKPRGAPENVGSNLQTTHPVVRTNPVTGWKSIFPVGGFARHINGLTEAESNHLLKWFLDLVYQNHDLQVRLKWKNKNDIAIWDNRSVYHTMTLDYHGLGDRFGNRAVGIGERPYFDPKSTSRRVDLNIPYIQ
ncbi:taurine catabolism dioxygenase [Cryphonectria parasitica EP155]|uniref:Taurine catabolism dioxygenase n=1 Tax=Cryphonectria parasitica (strain ATCC 38755 / EP155) TaxID=660469 RepID=A0A9P4Y4T0_CRYP1|nr:taurine catabolism dioxygenase [Cryphonectria parasitica EP155]KAF3766927.1 taurine catabolism dioxygenase [Cryphonectria parasitica EP155]